MKLNPRSAEQPKRRRTRNQYEDSLVTRSRSSRIRGYGCIDERNLARFPARSKAWHIIEPCERFPIYCRACEAFLHSTQKWVFRGLFRWKEVSCNGKSMQGNGKPTACNGKPHACDGKPLLVQWKVGYYNGKLHLTLLQ